MPIASSRTPRHRITAGLVAVGASIVLVACGGDDSSMNTTTVAPAEPTAAAEAEASVRSIESVAAGRPGDEPGCAIGVGDDTAEATTAFGVADVDTGRPNDESTLFDLGSVSKQFTGGVILGLVEEGDVTLDDTVSSWIPEIDGPAGDVALRDLLHHRSGIPDYTALLVEDGVGFGADATQADAIDSLTDTPLDFEPGSRFTYSNSNYILLAEVAQRAAEQPFAELVERRLLEPAGMATAFFSDYHSSSPGVATSYSPAPDFLPQHYRWTQIGDGAIHTSITDMLAWGRHLLPQVESFVEDAEPAGGGEHYGAGVFVEQVDGEDIVFHSGQWQGFLTYFAVIPDEDLTVAVLCNRADATPAAVAADALAAWRSAA